MQCAVLRRVSIIRRVKMEEKLLEKRKCPESYIILAKRINERKSTRLIEKGGNCNFDTLQKINLSWGEFLALNNKP